MRSLKSKAKHEQVAGTYNPDMSVATGSWWVPGASSEQPDAATTSATQVSYIMAPRYLAVNSVRLRLCWPASRPWHAQCKPSSKLPRSKALDWHCRCMQEASTPSGSASLEVQGASSMAHKVLALQQEQRQPRAVYIAAQQSDPWGSSRATVEIFDGQPAV